LEGRLLGSQSLYAADIIPKLSGLCWNNGAGITMHQTEGTP